MPFKPVKYGWIDESNVIKGFFTDLAGLRPSKSKKQTWKIYRWNLARFFQFLGEKPDDWVKKPDEEKLKDAKRYLDNLARDERVADATLRAARTALASFGKYLGSWDSGDLTKVSVNGTVKKETPFTKDILKKIVEYADLRERAFILLAATTGLRISELAGLTLDDIKEFWERDREPYKVVVRAEVAKGGKERVTFATQEARDAVVAYVERLKREGRSRWDGKHVFLSRGRCFNLFQSALRKANVKSDKDSWYRVHGLRKYFRTVLAVSGVSPDLIEKLMGHGPNSLSQTYTATWDELLRKEYAKAIPNFNIFRTSIAEERERIKAEIWDDIRRSGLPEEKVQELSEKWKKLESLIMLVLNDEDVKQIFRRKLKEKADEFELVEEVLENL
jgi:integrase